MAKKGNVKEILAESQQTQTLWQAIPEFKMGEIGLKEFTAVVEAADSLDKDYAEKSLELTGLKVNREAAFDHLNDLLTRFRSGIRAAYGPNSAQYEQAGGTRKGARKTSKVKTNSEATDAKSA